MTDKIFKILIATLLCCSFCLSSVSAYAYKEIDTDVFEEITSENNRTTVEETEEKSTDDENFMPTDIEIPEEVETTKRKPIKVTTTRKPARPERPERPARPEAEYEPNRNEEAHNDEEEETEVEETTLPEGSYFVYLERNNGSRKLKRVLNGKSLIPYPPEPKRKGYFFDGWYKDKKLTQPWDFYTSYAEKEMTLYARWIADKTTIDYDIIIKDNILGGKIEVNPQRATEGEPIVITVIPDEGNRLKQGSITINGKKSDVLSFLMPGKSVVVGAEFEKIPEVAEEKEKSIIPFIIIAVAILIIIIVIVLLLIRHKNAMENIAVDENGTVIEDDDNDKWVDKSIVVEDGFQNGEKIKGNIEPDYGAPDAPDDEDWFK